MAARIVYEDHNVLTEVVYPYFGSQRRAAEALGTTAPSLVRRRDKGGVLLSAEEAVMLEELTRGELDRTRLRPDLWPARRWKKIRY